MDYLSDWQEVADYLNLLHFQFQYAESRLEAIDASVKEYMSHVGLT